MKKSLILILTIILSLSVFAGSGLAAENKSHLTKEQRESILEALDKAGLTQETKVKILSKIERGELLDSQNPAMIGKGKVEKKRILDANGSFKTVTTTTYPDGSVTIESIGGGQVTCGTGYCNVKGATVSHFSGFVYAEFKADYTHVNQGYDYISSVYEWNISGAGNLSNIELILARAKETAYDDAYAYLRFIGTLPGDYYTTTFYLRFYVGNDDAWDDANW